MRKTKIVCTIGPATESKEQLEKLFDAGMSVVRLNFSHGDHVWHKEVIDRVKEINKKRNTYVPILLDTKGPEIRTTQISGKMQLHAGDKVQFIVGSVCDENECETHNDKTIAVNYKKFIQDLKKGDVIMLDSGLIRAKVYKKDENHVYATVLDEGELANKKHVNLPGIKVDLPSITPKDKKDIEFGIMQGVDFIALSFVRSAKDIEHVRKILKKHKSHAKIIAKVEDRQAVENLQDIVEAADGVMVARGDLGIEVPMEEVPSIQMEIVKTCVAQAKPVIVATHLLESMIDHPVPTRAEVTDITVAVWESADGIMLSGETTAGKYPIESVKTMDRIARRAEQDFLSEILAGGDVITEKSEIARSACLIARNLDLDAIIIPTRTGRTAREVASFRPRVPMIAFAENENVLKDLSLTWGIQSVKIAFGVNDPETSIMNAFKNAKKAKLLKKGAKVLVVSNILAGNEKVEAIQIREV